MAMNGVSFSDQRDRSERFKARGGFSLAEVVIGAGVLAMFMVGLPLVVRMARNAVPDGSTPGSAVMDASRVLEMMAADVAFATSIESGATFDANHISFTVPDRNGDGQAEMITYACDLLPPGTAPQAPAGLMRLTRQYNGTLSSLLNSVYEFQLLYDTFSVAQGSAASAGPATLLASNNSAGGMGQVKVDGGSGFAQFIEPLLPAGTVSWNLTAVDLRMSTQAARGSVSVQVRPAIGGLPSSTVLDQVSLASFPRSMSWQTVKFTNANGLSPYAGVCVVVLNTSGNAACNLGFSANQNYTGGYLTSNDSGQTWSQDASHDLLFNVYGQANCNGNGGSGASYYLNDVRCTVRTSSNPTSRVLTTIRVYNQPQVPHP